MLDHDSRIALGVSGGKDSLSLLELLKRIEEKYPHSELIAISIDEGISGYRDEALTLASEACKKLGVEHRQESFRDIFGITMDEIAKRQRELSTCSYCGVLRRRALDKAAKALGADRLATAHNLDDMAQTALLNLLRGDLNRLAMIDPGGKELPNFVRRIKPFCEVPERESTLYAYIRGIEFQSLPCPYASEAMRTDARDFLNRMEDKRPSTKFIVYRTALKLTPQDERKSVRHLCKECGEPTTGETCRVCQLIEGLGV
jgi:uncharacterized protein (TIGR00269 family)